MRVLTLTTLYPNRRQPARAIFIHERMRHVARVCDLEVVAPVALGRGAGIAWEEELDGVRVRHPRYVALPGRWPRLNPLAIAAGSWRIVRRLHARAPFDLVDTHFAHPDGAAALRLADRLGLPLVLSLRGSDIHRDFRDARLRRRILETCRRAAAVIAVAAPLAETLGEAGSDPSRIHVIPNGVDSDLFAPRDRETSRKEVGVDDATPLLLAVGQLVPVKGFDLLLEAFARLTAPCRLHIAGEGPGREELMRLAGKLGIAERVHFLGLIPHAELARHYSAADAFCLSSRNEGCPNVVLEALASGCPVAAASVGEIPHLIEEGVNGMLAAPQDPVSLGKAIERLLHATLDREAVRRTVAARTWERVAACVQEVFAGVVAATDTPVDRGISACSAHS